jgi:hypothetical protein
VDVYKQSTGLPKRSGLVKKHYKPKHVPAAHPIVTDVMKSKRIPDMQKVENNSSFFGKNTS